MQDFDLIRAVSEEVYYADSQFAVAGPDAVETIKQRAQSSPRRRCRVCFHPDPGARSQEMLICMHGDSYVRPHRHWQKSETMTVLEGRASALLFQENGALASSISMGPYGSGRAFFYRMPEGVFHTLLFETEWLVYLETTSGPFDPGQSDDADWSPAGDDPVAIQDYRDSLKIEIAKSDQDGG